MKVSVIIPTWNRGHIIEPAIRSVLNQTMKDLEVLVCDDGSTDNTKEVVAAIRDPRVRWITGRIGRRPAVPRNNGLREVRGEWVAFLDSDDEWAPDRLAKQLAAAEQRHLNAVCSNAARLVPGQGIIGYYLDFPGDTVTFADLLKDNRIINSSVLMKADLFAGVRGFPEGDAFIGCEDYALWLRVASYGPFAYLPEPLVVYRDDAAASVRALSPLRGLKQQRAIFGNYLMWAVVAGTAVHLLEAARAYLRLLIKTYGLKR